MSLTTLAIASQIHLNNAASALGNKISNTYVDVKGLLSCDGAANSSLSNVGDTIDSYGKGVFSLGQKAAVYVAAIVILGFFIGMLVHGTNVQKRSEKKEGVPYIIIGAIGIFAVPVIIVFLQKIGVNIL